MKPTEFSWTDDQQVTVTNPTAKDYKFMVHGKAYMVEAGRIAKMPGYIAWLYVYGMASQLAQSDKRFGEWNEETTRKEYYEKVLVGVDEVVQTIQQEPEPEVRTFDEPPKPAPGTGMSYTNKFEAEAEKPKRGRPTKV